MKKYDYLVVGAGLFGSVFAYLAAERGKRCLVIDKRNHIGGNCFTELQAGINVHIYGAHIFRTSDKNIWNFMNKFAEFNNFINSPIANCNGRIFNLPFNMNTFNKVWGCVTPEEARAIINQQKAEIQGEPKNLEEKAISLIGRDLFELFVKDYTEKQWGRSCKDLPASIISRIPVRYIYDNNYFNDRYQGIPIGGYTQIFEKLLGKCDVELNCDFCNNRGYLSDVAEKVIYTGTIDSYFDYCFGRLEYRGLRFENEHLPIRDFQGVAVVNYPTKREKYTRIIEHKHFEFLDTPTTIITREYPLESSESVDPYYPINDSKNQSLFSLYKQKSKLERNVLFGGRLGEYRYYDMQDTIKSAFNLAELELR